MATRRHHRTPRVHVKAHSRGHHRRNPGLLNNKLLLVAGGLGALWWMNKRSKAAAMVPAAPHGSAIGSRGGASGGSFRSAGFANRPRGDGGGWSSSFGG